MPDKSSRLYGREQTISVTYEFMTRPEDKDRGVPTSRPVPVVMITGPRGCGKTALLSELETRLEGNVPSVKVDCGSLDPAAPSWDVLSFLVFEFNRRDGSYRKVPFPRFMTARLVIGENLDLIDIDIARKQVRESILRYRRVRAFLDGVADVAGQTAAAIPGFGGLPGAANTTRGLARLVLKGLVSWRPVRRVALGEGPRWWGLGNEGIDKLIHLNRLTRSMNDDGVATEWLWAAFLADLRAAFGKGRGKRAWSLNCAVLLDNVDSKPGIILLKQLVRARQQYDVSCPGGADPLTVVASSAGTFIQDQLALDGEMPTAEEASYTDYQSRTGIDSKW